MRSQRLAGGLVLMLILLPTHSLRAQDWRGEGRVDGWVKDQSGQGVANATLRLTREGGGGPSTKTDAKGYWAVLGLIGGTWNVDVSAAGYETRKVSVRIQETRRIPPMEIVIQKAAPTAPAVDTSAGNAGAEALTAVKEGNRLLGEKKYAEARAQYEKALAVLPQNTALWKGIAQTYHGEGNNEKTIEALKKAVELDPNDTEAKILLGSLLIEAGQLDQAKAAFDSLPPGAVKDPAVYLNVTIALMNKGKLDDARTYATRAIEMDPAQPEGYYYRGLASIQLKKNPEAKVDFRKYLEIAPNGPEAKEVREMLQALK